MSITVKGSGYSHTISDQGMYPDNTPMLKVDDFAEMVDKADTMVIQHTGLQEFVTAMFLADAIWTNGGSIDRLILPYIPGARQDRSNPTGDVLYTLSSVAEMVNMRAFQRVVVLDPHSPKVYDMLYSLVVYPQALVARGLPNSRFHGIIAADNGGRTRAEDMGAALHLPVFYGGKTRDVRTGKLSGFTLEPIPGGHYLVVDDICDGGGTFIGLAEKIHEQDSTADLFVSHGIFSKGTKALLDYYGSIYTTDSLVRGDGTKVNVIPVVEDMERYIG